MTAAPLAPPPFADRLARAIEEKQSCLVVGLDPVLDRLPPYALELWGGSTPGNEGLTARAALAFGFFLREVVRVVADVAVAVKPNTAFFERYGAAGWECLREVCRDARSQGLLVIADAKRGDVSHTAAAYAEALLGETRDTLGPHVDAVTLNPYLGSDSVAPYLERVRAAGKGLFVLVRTSNPSSSELQELAIADGRPLYLHVAERVATWGEGFVGACGLSSVGAVVGATAPRQAAELRAALPQTTFLVPGLGAQGARPEDLGAYFLEGGRGALVNASRSILFAYQNEAGRAAASWIDAIRAAALQTRDALEAVRKGSSSG